MTASARFALSTKLAALSPVVSAKPSRCIVRLSSAFIHVATPSSAPRALTSSSAEPVLNATVTPASRHSLPAAVWVVTALSLGFRPRAPHAVPAPTSRPSDPTIQPIVSHLHGFFPPHETNLGPFASDGNRMRGNPTLRSARCAPRRSSRNADLRPNCASIRDLAGSTRVRRQGMTVPWQQLFSGARSSGWLLDSGARSLDGRAPQIPLPEPVGCIATAAA